MPTATDLDNAIKSVLADWAPVPVFRENEPAKTKNLDEYIVLVNLGGAGIAAVTTGLLGQRGSTERHAFLLRFEIYTQVDSGTLRASELADNVTARWRYQQLTLGIQLFESSIEHVGKEAARFKTIVYVSGQRDEKI